MEMIFTSPNTAPGGLSAVEKAINHSSDLVFQVSGPGMPQNAFVKNVASGGNNLVIVTPREEAVSYHRNMVGRSGICAYVTQSQVLADHYGRQQAVITGWTKGDDSILRPFALVAKTPMNPGGFTNYAQQEEYARLLVEATKDLGPYVLDIHGMPTSIPVTIGRGRRAPALQVTGYTVNRLHRGGVCVFDADSQDFNPDPEDNPKPALRPREMSRIRGRDFWPVLTDAQVESLTALADGTGNADNPGNDPHSIKAFLADIEEKIEAEVEG